MAELVDAAGLSPVSSEWGFEFLWVHARMVERQTRLIQNQDYFGFESQFSYKPDYSNGTEAIFRILWRKFKGSNPLSGTKNKERM